MSAVQALTDSFSALSLDKITGFDRPGIEHLENQVIPEVKRLTSEYQTACEEFNALAQVKQERTAGLAEVSRERNEGYIAAIQEMVANPVADGQALGMHALPLERRAELLQDTVDFVNRVLFPAALDKKLETRRDLLRAEHLEAALYAALSHATMLEKLERAGLSQSHGRIIAYSETTEKLKLVASECHVKAQQADANLTAARAAAPRPVPNTCA